MCRWDCECVEGLFWALTARQRRHKDSIDSIMAASIEVTIIIIDFVPVCVCVCVRIFIPKLLLFGLHYNTVMNNVWQKSLKVSFKHETPALAWLWALTCTVFSVSFNVRLNPTNFHLHWETFVIFSYKADLMAALWITDKVENNLVYKSFLFNHRRSNHNTV